MNQEQMVVTVCVGLVCLCGIIGIWANWRPSNLKSHRRIHTSMYTAPVVTPWDAPLPPRIDWIKVDQDKQGKAEAPKAVPVDPFNL